MEILEEFLNYLGTSPEATMYIVGGLTLILLFLLIRKMLSVVIILFALSIVAVAYAEYTGHDVASEINTVVAEFKKYLPSQGDMDLLKDVKNTVSDFQEGQGALDNAVDAVNNGS